MGVVGGKRVAESGGLGEWVSGGRLTAGGGEVAGRAFLAIGADTGIASMMKKISILNTMN